MDIGLALGTEARGVHNSLLDKSATTGGEGWPGTLRNGATLTAYAPNINLVHASTWGRAQEVRIDAGTAARCVTHYLAVRQFAPTSTIAHDLATNRSCQKTPCSHRRS